MRLIYSALLYVIAPLALARLAWLGIRDRGYLRGWRDRFGIAPPPRAAGKLVWIHAVSVGEVQAARPLVERLRAAHSGCPLLVTTTTPTGAAAAMRDLGPGVEHRYFPFDLPGAVGRFLDGARPRALVVMETEIWPNLFAACAARAIPVALVNARMSSGSYAGYRRVPGLVAQTLRCVSLVAAQTGDDAARLAALGADPARTIVSGSVKFDVRLAPSVREQAQPLRRTLGVDRPVLIAASTHEGEDVPVLEAFRTVRTAHPGALLILAPRHPQRARAVAELCRARALSAVTRSSGTSAARAEVLIADTLGELVLFYALADVAFVGGSLVPVGGHNMLEPAALGVPVLTGPHLFNFPAVAALLVQAGAARIVNDAAELGQAATQLLGNASDRARAGEAGRAAVEANRGAIERVMRALGPLLAVSAADPTPP
ncbi:MAG: lipid IV(A) 3-deoxy-D-manno-octulosonic acid transferase [Gammaproteobacteria bacterium]